MDTLIKDTDMIHQAIQIPNMTYIGYQIGGIYILVIRHDNKTTVYRTDGAHIRMIEALESKGFKEFKHGGK